VADPPHQQPTTELYFLRGGREWKIAEQKWHVKRDISSTVPAYTQTPSPTGNADIICLVIYDPTSKRWTARRRELDSTSTDIEGATFAVRCFHRG